MLVFYNIYIYTYYTYICVHMYVFFHNKNYTIIIIIHTTILPLCGLNKKRFACSYKYGMYDLVENELTILNQNLNLDPAQSFFHQKREFIFYFSCLTLLLFLPSLQSSFPSLPPTLFPLLLSS